MSRMIVFYYTLEGNSGFAAETAAELSGAEIERLQVGKEPPKKGLGKFLVGGGAAIRGTDPGLLPVAAQLQEYDAVILAYPIWAGKFPPAIGAFLERYDLTGKDVYVITSSSSGNPGKSVQQVAAKTGGVRAYLSLLNPLKHREEAKAQIKAFLEQNQLNG